MMRSFAMAMVTAILFLSCKRDVPKAVISVENSAVTFGQEIRLRVAGLPDDWSGEINVNNIRRLPIDRQRLNILTSRRNGFEPSGLARIFVVLLDRRGLEIPLVQGSHLEVQVSPSTLTVSPETETVDSRGGSYVVHVTAPSAVPWATGGIPKWVVFGSDPEGKGSQTLTYKVAPNAFRQARSAIIPIGDSVLQIDQMAGQMAETAPVSALSSHEDRESTRVESGIAMARVTIDRTTVKMGDEIRMHFDPFPAEWHGELMVNLRNRFQVESKDYSLKVLQVNGFSSDGLAELYLLMMDSKGRAIPLTDQGRFRIMVQHSTVRFDQESRSLDAKRAAGRVSVTADDGLPWVVQGVPDWVRISEGGRGVGNGSFTYVVQENNGNRARSARLAAEDATFEITQSRAPSIHIPFEDSFQTSAVPPFLEDMVATNGLAGDLRPSWYIDNHQKPKPVIAKDASASIVGHSLRIDKKADPVDWATQLVLPGVAMEIGKSYKVAVSIRADHPGKVSLAASQRTEPFENCGLDRSFQVSEKWTNIVARFRASGTRCGEDNNRISIMVGRMDGRLWISDFSITHLD